MSGSDRVGAGRDAGPEDPAVVRGASLRRVGQDALVEVGRARQRRRCEAVAPATPCAPYPVNPRKLRSRTLRVLNVETIAHSRSSPSGSSGTFEQRRKCAVHGVRRRLEVHALEVLAVGPEGLEMDRVVARRGDVRRDGRVVGNSEVEGAVTPGRRAQPRVLRHPDRRAGEQDAGVVELVRRPPNVDRPRTRAGGACEDGKRDRKRDCRESTVAARH